MICSSCTQCTKFVKNFKPMSNFNSAKFVPSLRAPSSELQLDCAGPLSYGERKNNVAIDTYTKFPSVMLTRSTGSRKVTFKLTRSKKVTISAEEKNDTSRYTIPDPSELAPVS